MTNGDFLVSKSF